jgi:hypothetical protein
MTIRILLVLAAALLARTAVAQVELSAAYEAAKAATPAKSVKTAAQAPVAAAAKSVPSSCEDAKELETPLEFTLKYADGRNPLELRFEYAGCDWAPRNDYLPPYTEREYKAKDGYGLTIVTDEGKSASEVLFSKDAKWVGNFGAYDNAAIVSGDPVVVNAADHEDSNKILGKATVRNAAKPLYPQLQGCEAADWSKASATGAPARTNGKPATGYDNYRGAPTLVLLTKTAAFYYHEDCDICAEVTRCDLTTHALTSAAVGHSVDCTDMKKYRSEPGVVYDSCTP